MKHRNIIKPGTVFAPTRNGSIHNEIIRVYTDNGRRMVEVDQYGATLETKEHHRKVVFYVREIRSALNSGLAHIVLVRR